MSTLVVPDGRAFEVTCDVCPEWRIVRSSEQSATYEAARHESRDARRLKAAQEAIEHFRTIEVKPSTRVHRHTAMCTQSSCPGADTWFCIGTCTVFSKDREMGKACVGHRIPTREELVARSRARRAS